MCPLGTVWWPMGSVGGPWGQYGIHGTVGGPLDLTKVTQSIEGVSGTKLSHSIFYFQLELFRIQ